MMTGTQSLPEMVLRETPSRDLTEAELLMRKGLISDIGPVVGQPTLFLERIQADGETYVKKTEMMDRVKEMPSGPTGLSYAERMLEQEDGIPVEWRGLTLVFTGTVWPGGKVGGCSRGYQAIVCAHYVGKWILYLDSLIGDWFPFCRVVRVRLDTEGSEAGK